MAVYTRFNPGMNIWCSVFTFANQISIRTLVQSIMDLVNSKLHVASNIGLEFRKVVLNHILILQLDMYIKENPLDVNFFLEEINMRNF